MFVSFDSVLAGLSLIILVSYTIVRLWYHATKLDEPTGIDSEKGTRQPPLLPHIIPFLGRIPLRFLWDPITFSLTDSALWQRQTVRVRALFQDIYIIQGSKDMRDFMNQRSLSTYFLHPTFLTNGFGLPAEAAETFRKDNSGEHFKPIQGTTVEDRHRIEFHARNTQHKLLAGSGQKPLYRRFDSNATERLSSLQITEEGTYISDFLEIFHYDLGAAVVESLAGPALLQRDPSFIRHLWEMDDGIMSLLLGLPRFMNRKAHNARQQALATITDWQTWAKDNFRPDAIEEDGGDPFWGSRFFRERHEMWSNVDNFGRDAMASVELALIWSTITNPTVASFWLVLEAFRDPELLQAVRKEVGECLVETPGQEKKQQQQQPSFDMDKLLRQPLLQAMYAENLRLRVHGFLVRRPERTDIRVNNFLIPRNHICLSSATPAGNDAEFWCQGENSAHPVDQFWPGRFLARRGRNTETTGDDDDDDALEFTTAGTEGHWVPFGGGPHGCPGKHFTKRQNLLSLAIMVTLYDCDVLATQEAQALKTGAFPLGVVPPQGKIPVRMTRRSRVP